MTMIVFASQSGEEDVSSDPVKIMTYLVEAR